MSLQASYGVSVVNMLDKITDIEKYIGPRSLTNKNRGGLMKTLIVVSDCPLKKLQQGTPVWGISMLKKIRPGKTFGATIKPGFSMCLSVLHSDKGPKVFTKVITVKIWWHYVCNMCCLLKAACKVVAPSPWGWGIWQYLCYLYSIMIVM